MRKPCHLHPHRHPRLAVQGFTAIELMIVIGITAILIALAAPSFRPIIEKWRIRDAAENFSSTMYYARSEAIRRGGNVVLEKNSLTAQDCPQATDTADWDCGWFVYADLDRNGSYNASTDQIIRQSPPLKAVQFTNKLSLDHYVFNRWGKAGGGNMIGFTVSPVGAGITSPYVTTLCASIGGRIERLEGDVACN